MKKLLSYLFTKWWPLVAISAVSMVLFFITDNGLLWLLSFLAITVSLVSQFNKRRWGLGFLTSVIILVYISLTIIWIFIQLFPSPEMAHHRYADLYEDRSEIEDIIGVEIPRFKVINSELVHFRNMDFEFRVKSELEFKSDFDDRFFHELDSICTLPTPEKPDENSSFFYYGLEQIGRCWTKSGGHYYYSRNTDFGGKFLHSTDAYFEFSITKGSRTAKMSYGNY